MSCETKYRLVLKMKTNKLFLKFYFIASVHSLNLCKTGFLYLKLFDTISFKDTQ